MRCSTAEVHGAGAHLTVENLSRPSPEREQCNGKLELMTTTQTALDRIWKCKISTMKRACTISNICLASFMDLKCDEGSWSSMTTITANSKAPMVSHKAVLSMSSSTYKRPLDQDWPEPVRCVMKHRKMRRKQAGLQSLQSCVFTHLR